MTTSTDEYTVILNGEDIELSREERKVITYLINVMDGEAAKSTDVKEFTNLDNRTDLHRLKKRLEGKGLIETFEGSEYDDSPLNNPLYWDATERAYEVADVAVMVTDEMTVAERMTLIEQEMHDVREDVDRRMVQGDLADRLEGLAIEVEILREDVKSLEKKYEAERQKRDNSQQYIRAIVLILNAYDLWPEDDPTDFCNAVMEDGEADTEEIRNRLGVDQDDVRSIFR